MCVLAQIRIDDVTVVQNVSFTGTVVRRIGLYAFDAGTVWFDEVRCVCKFSVCCSHTYVSCVALTSDLRWTG